jgi:phage tail protein X
MPLKIKVAGAGITVAKLLWRHGGRRGNTSARLAETLELNPGLAALGPVLPLGTRVTLPDLPPASTQPRAAVPAVSLFDD